MRDAAHTRMTGKTYLTNACIVGDSPYPVGPDGEEIIPIPVIPLGSPRHVHPHYDNFSTPELTHSADPWGEALRQLTARLPAIGNLAALPRLTSFIQHEVLSQIRAECREFQSMHPSAYRSRTPQDVATVMFHYHAGIVKAISATTFPVGAVHGDVLSHLVHILLADRFCRFSEKDLSMLQSALRACHEEKIELLVGTARARSYLPSDLLEFEAPITSPSLSPQSGGPGKNALESLIDCYDGVEDIDHLDDFLFSSIPPTPVPDPKDGYDGVEDARPLQNESLEIDPLDDFLFSSIPPTPVPDPKDGYEVERILQHNRYGRLSKEIEFLCHFLDTDSNDDLWLPIEKLTACSSILREYWENTPVQIVHSTSPVIAPATLVAVPCRREGRRVDGSIWSSVGKLGLSKVARRVFIDYCDDVATSALSPPDQRALREWFGKYVNSNGKEATRDRKVVGIVTQQQFLKGAAYWEAREPHQNLKEAGLRMFHLRPAVLRYCAVRCTQAPYEMIVAELK